MELLKFCKKYRNMRRDIPNGLNDILMYLDEAKSVRAKWNGTRKDLQVGANANRSQTGKASQRDRSVLSQNSQNTPESKKKRNGKLTPCPEEIEGAKPNSKKPKKDQGLLREVAGRGARQRNEPENRIQLEKRDERKVTAPSK